MIINHSVIGETYRCGKLIMQYLVSSGLPILSYDEKYYYFANTDLLKKSLEDMPLYLKIVSSLRKKGG